MKAISSKRSSFAWKKQYLVVKDPDEAAISKIVAVKLEDEMEAQH